MTTNERYSTALDACPRAHRTARCLAATLLIMTSIASQADTSTPAPLLKRPSALLSAHTTQTGIADENEKAGLHAPTRHARKRGGSPHDTGPVNINRANANELALHLSGLGHRRAQAIVARREKHGTFRNVSDLDAIKGIGPRQIDRWRSQIRLE